MSRVWTLSAVLLALAGVGFGTRTAQGQPAFLLVNPSDLSVSTP